MKSEKKKIIIESCDPVLKTTIKIPSNETVIVGNQGAILVPELNILPIQGVGNKDIVCDNENCLYMLAKDVTENQILVSIKCPSCGTIRKSEKAKLSK